MLFCDLRGFTSFAETAEPEEVMAVLREFHHAVGPMIFDHGGTIAQFTGDGMLVFFNDPVPLDDPAWDAVRLAIAMRERTAGAVAAVAPARPRARRSASASPSATPPAARSASKAAPSTRRSAPS